MATTREWCDADFFAGLRRLVARRRRQQARRLAAGPRSSPLGASRQFQDRRAYVPGDDYRSIDWHAYARLNKRTIRLYEDLPELHCHVLVDDSVSMTGPYPAKARLARQVAVALAYTALEQGLRVSLYRFADRVVGLVRPGRGLGHLDRLVTALDGMGGGTPGDPLRALGAFRPGGGGQRHAVVVISDCLGPQPERIAGGLRRAAARWGELDLVQILHPEERRPPWRGRWRLQGVEGDGLALCELSAEDIARYEATVQNWCAEIQALNRHDAVQAQRWDTDDHFDERLLGFLQHSRCLRESA